MQRFLRDIGIFSVFACLMALMLPTAAAAHPHVWVKVETEVIYNEQKAITGFRHKWDFDEYYSAFAVQGLDKNGDGKYDRAELAELAEVNVSSLKDFGYFTFPKIAGKLVERNKPIDYWLEYSDGILTLKLTVPLKDPIAAEGTKDLVFGVFDPTFYVDFAFVPKDPVRLSHAPSGCAPSVKDPDPQAQQGGGVSTLGEAYFNDIGTDPSIAEGYAKSVRIVCAAG